MLTASDQQLSTLDACNGVATLALEQAIVPMNEAQCLAHTLLIVFPFQYHITWRLARVSAYVESCGPEVLRFNYDPSSRTSRRTRHTTSRTSAYCITLTRHQ